MKVAPVTLEGTHVRLEPLGPQHAEAMILLAEDRTTFEWSLVPTVAEVPGYIGTAVAAMARGEALVFATLDRRTGQLIGSTRLFDLQRWIWQRGVDPRSGQEVLDAAEIGYTWLAQRAQRTPINTEAKLLMLAHTFDAWRCRRVTLKTDARNQRSRDAIARLGAKFDGIIRAQQPAADGVTIRDTACFTILDAEWPAVRAGLEARLER